MKFELEKKPTVKEREKRRRREARGPGVRDCVHESSDAHQRPAMAFYNRLNLSELNVTEKSFLFLFSWMISYRLILFTDLQTIRQVLTTFVVCCVTLKFFPPKTGAFAQWRRLPHRSADQATSIYK